MEVRALRVAKRHVRNGYETFGLAERFVDTVHLFASKLGVEASLPKWRHKKTPDRLARGELDDETLQALRDLNAADVELYEYAVSRFEQQFDEGKETMRPTSEDRI